MVELVFGNFKSVLLDCIAQLGLLSASRTRTATKQRGVQSLPERGITVELGLP